ncbi:MAG: hypothetical protein Q7S74_06000 [Nanoarchaeota archaeon]|nr:hypothetical protein [Nanoarchaeota archaeon]
MDSTKARLINKYLKIYPDGSSAVTYSSNLNSLYKIDSSLSGTLIEFEDKPRTISLLSVSQPTQIANADILIENQAAVNLRVDQSINLTKGGSSIGQINLDRLNVDEAQVSATCVVNTQGQLSGITRYLLHPDGSGVQICGLSVVLRKSNSEQVAKIRIIPQAEGTTTQTNFSIGIGIEKRAIKLSPDKTQDRINELNKTIEKWESISNSLGKVVSGLKAACFATAGILTFKNFLSGMSGETIARQQVMGGENGWRNMCKNMTGADRQYAKLDECYLANAGKIDADVQKISSNIGKINDKITSIQSKYVKSSDIFGQSIDSTAAKADVAKYARDTYGDTVIDTSTLRVPITDENGKRVDKITVADLLSEDNVNKGYVSNDMLRSAMLYGEAQKSGGLSAGESQNLNSNIIDVERQVYQNRIIARDVQNNEKSRSNGIPPVFYSGRDPASMRTAVVSPLNSDLRTKLGFTDPNVKYIASVRADGTMVKGANGQDSVGLPSGVYILGLTGGDGGVYSVKEVSQQTGDSYKVVSDSVAKSSLVNTIGNIRSADRVSYIHEIVPADRVVRYYETEPYKGMPAVVPFDVKQGWYAATKQTLPAFGGIGAFDASGKVSSFWLCNVGENGRVDFESSGFGDDTCQRIDTTTGQPAAFSGLSQNEAERRKNQATQAIDEAARQYGKGLKYVNIMGERMEVGNPSTGTPGTQCQDFMSPKDCFILFNVCDPVICPSSRCDFGGTYPVADVVQTGIVGSVLLCLPNIKEGIIVPVCLTGIKAGIDSLISIIKNYRDCLEENLKTGQMVGICDEIYSIYLCEFFWRQVAPLLNVLIPKLIESSYGQGTRGGGEYLTVNAAWQNMGNSIDYFTQSYAVNSIKAFQVRNIDEVGGQFCKAFISAKSPTAFKSLIEPDSPPQFYAWFDAAPYTSATVPATSQYKVFYHIFSGNDQGVQFSVYLRNPPQSSYYATPYYVQVATGFVPKGQYKSETRDFTAPQGYKELCVRINEDEQCGFKQVSTDFAINYLKDQYVANQLTNTNIGSEKECIGGSADIGAVLTNPNLQGGVQEAGAPAIYNRGIVRICGTSNPGLSTNPQRFVDVGQCDDPKVRCWLDKNSVSNAITSNNIGLQNATLQQLENRTMDVLQQNGQIFTPEDAAGELNSLRRAIGDLATSQNKQTDAQAILNRITLVQDKFYLNYHRAWLLLLKGEVLEIIARGAYRMEVAQKQQTSQSTVGGSGILSQYGVSPYMDLEGRVKADFGGSIGSYGVNQGGQLEWYDLNANPAGWTSVEYKLSSSDSSTTQAQKQWLIQLKQELTTARDKINSGSSGTVISQPATSVFSNIISVGDVESFGGNVRFISMNGIKTRVFFEKSSDSDLTIEGQLKVKNLLGTQNSASDTVILNTFKTIDSSDKSLILKSDLDDKVISESNFNSELWGVRTIDRWMIHQRSIISDDDYKVLTEMASQNIKYSVVGGDWLKRGNAANGVSNNGGTTTQPVSQPSSQSAIKYYSLDVGDTLDRNIRFGGAKTGIYIDYNSGSNGPFVMYVEDINGPVGLIHDTSAQIQITNFDSVDSITKGYLNDLNGKQYQLLLDGKIKEGVVVDDNQAPGGVVVPGSLGS